MTAPVMRVQRELGERDRRFSVRALIASSVGTTIEFYDFVLYSVVAAIYLGKLYFPGHDPFLSTLAAFGTILTGFVSRPVGAALFGHCGDRVGRKAMLIVTLVMMGAASIGIGLVPTYAQIGIWGAVLLVILRTFQGLGVSGEWGGAVLLGVEWQRSGGRRGWAGGWAQIGVPAGTVLANLALLASTALLGQDSYWGWRVPFLAGAVLVGIGLYVRLGILETPAFTRVLEQRRQFRWPLISVVRSSWRQLILAIMLQCGPAPVGLLFTTFILTYATTVLGIQQSVILTFVLVGSATWIGAILFFSRLSDGIGRRRTYIVGAVLAMVLAIPYWWLLDSRIDLLVLLSVVLALAVSAMQLGPLAAYVAEAFPTRVRYTGAGLGYNLGSAGISGTASIIALSLLHTFHTSTAIGLYTMAAAFLSLIGAFLLRDRSRERIDEHDDVTPLAVTPS